MFNDSKKHLDDAGESYIQHLMFALNISIKLLIAGIQCFLHALVHLAHPKWHNTQVFACNRQHSQPVTKANI